MDSPKFITRQSIKSRQFTFHERATFKFFCDISITKYFSSWKTFQIYNAKTPCDLTPIKTLAQQIYPRAKDFLPWAYHDAVDKENFSRLVVDLKPQTNSAMRVRANNFDLFPIVHIPRNL